MYGWFGGLGFSFAEVLSVWFTDCGGVVVRLGVGVRFEVNCRCVLRFYVCLRGAVHDLDEARMLCRI